MARLARIAPEVPISDLRASVCYYEKKLGFRIAMEMPEGDYAVMERDDVAIHLFQRDGSNPSRTSFHVFTDGLDELYGEFQRSGARISQGIVRKPWGTRDFRVFDDDGNEIKFTEPLQESS